MNLARLYFGLLIVALGIILLLGSADVLDAGEVIATWWPVAVIGAGLFAWLANPRHWAMPVVVMAVGTAILLKTTGVIDSLNIVIPALVIFVGLLVIFGSGRRSRATETGDDIRTFNVFSGSEVASHSPQFHGGNVGALFGGVEVDLRDATPAPDASLDVFVAFGGAEIKVPEGWRVDLTGLPLFGGMENVTAKEHVSTEAPALAVHATALFGGVEIKH